MLFVIYDLQTWALEKKNVDLINAFAKYQRIIRSFPPHGCSIAGCERGESQQPLQDTEGRRETCESLTGNVAEPAAVDGGDVRDTEVHWPSVWLLVGDALFAILFQASFWICIATTLSNRYYYGSLAPVVWASYAALGLLLVSILHAVAWWKEFMARMRLKWREEERKRVQTRGGHPTRMSTEDANALTGEANDVLDNWKTFLFRKQQNSARPREQEVDIEAAAGCATTNEELLINATPEGSSQGSNLDYGVLGASVQSLGGEPDIVVKSSKGKRVV